MDGIEETSISALPVMYTYRALHGAQDTDCERWRLVRIGGEKLQVCRRTLELEIDLSRLEWHEYESRIVLEHADIEGRRHLVGLESWHGTKCRNGTFG